MEKKTTADFFSVQWIFGLWAASWQNCLRRGLYFPAPTVSFLKSQLSVKPYIFSA